nr:DUF3131 domain-containing protein [Clostridia bacterium]
MSDFNLLKKAEKLYGQSDHYYMIERSCRRAITNLKHIRPQSRLDRMTALIYELLSENGCPDYDILRDALISTDDPPLENTELCAINDIIAVTVLRMLTSGRLSLEDSLETLRFLDSYDFEKLYGEVSPIEKILRTDDIYNRCDESTKRLYRINIERYARKHGLSEYTAATLMAHDAAKPEEHRTARMLYFPVLAFITAFLWTALLLILGGSIPLSLLLLLPVYGLSKQLTDLIMGRNTPADPLPRIELDKVPGDAPTLVVITSLLMSKRNDDALFDRLEQYMLANESENLSFGILGDLKDSTSETHEADTEIIENAQNRINSLNEKYGGRFSLFIRRRVYSESEERYMGWERKRGAVIELCRLIFGKDTTFDTVIEGKLPVSKVKYVITLDADTELYPGAVLEMLGTMLHPVNRPIIRNGMVISGHAVMQPRMETSLESAAQTPFSALMNGSGGSELYASAAFDLYQTVFGEGNFCGKGIFDAAAFIRCIDGVYPESSVLSHDLLEGLRLRAAYLSDIILTDSTPAKPLSWFMRQHRWIRGDVQALAFSSPTHKNAAGKEIENPIGGIGRFKLLDNLFRALIPVSSFAALTVSLIYGKTAACITLAAIAVMLLIPHIIPLCFTEDRLRRRFVSYVLSDIENSALRFLYELSALAYSAYISADAVIRAVWRMKVSRKKMLQWVTAAEGESGSANNELVIHLKKQWFSLAAGLFYLLFAASIPHKLLGALWLIVPFACILLSLKRRPKRQTLDDAGREKFAAYAADMWGYYSVNVKAADNHLPPDNVQKSPAGSVAHRTSPTNIGLYLLSAMAACDFGIISRDELHKRLSATLQTLTELPKWHGLLYNWYDTQKAEPLGSFVSTVDSGNFVTSLAALVSGLYEYGEKDERFNLLAAGYDELIINSDFRPLYNERRKLFYIGCDPENGGCGDNLYDIYMSEARTLSYFAVASGMVGRRHFASLARIYTSSDGYLGLMSWTGTMFEYFMPALLLPVYENSLSWEALNFTLRMQKKYGTGELWGRSESGYYMFDNDMNYQYKAFGVQKLGFKRGLDRENVLAPYAVFLAALIEPQKALENLAHFEKYGMYGRYGFYEAIDFTPSRVGQGNAVIRSYMAHHVGMSMVASANVCCDNIFVRRFMSYKRMSAYSSLLKERIHTNAAIYRASSKKAVLPRSNSRTVQSISEPETRCPAKNMPTHAAMLSNGYARGIALSDGSMTLLAGRASLTYPNPSSTLKAMTLRFSADGKIYHMGSGSFSYTQESVTYTVSDDKLKAEAKLTLHGERSLWCLTLDVNGDFSEICPLLVFEPVLYRPIDYLAHPAFAGLSVDSEYVRDENILLYSCRPRINGDNERWMAVTLEGSGFEFETRRDNALPALYGEADIDRLLTASFSRADGACIYPFGALKRTSSTLSGKYKCRFFISFGRSRADTLDNIRFIRRQKLRDVSAYMIPTLAKLTANQLASAKFNRHEVRLAELILSRIYGSCTAEKQAPSESSVADLWKYGISGDLPMICAELPKNDFAEGVVTSLLKVFRYLSMRGLRCDLIFIGAEKEHYGQERKNRLSTLIDENDCTFLCGKRGGIHTVSDLSSIELFQALAAVYVRAGIAADIESLYSRYMSLEIPHKAPIQTIPEYRHDDGSGGFGDKRYRLIKSPGMPPWSFVYSSPQFGTIVTQNTLGFTWHSNARQRRITPWENDPYPPLDSPNIGERLIMTSGNEAYDLCAVSDTVDFTYGYAEWTGRAGGVGFTVRAGIDEKLNVKLIYAELDADCNLEFKLRPCMGDSPVKDNMYNFETVGDTVFFSNRFKGEFTDST